MMMCDFFFLQRRTILIFSIFQKQWKSTQNLTEQIFEKPFYLQFNWQKLRWTRIKKIYKFLLQTQRDENIEWLSNSIHETIRFAFCTLYSSTYCLWSESISAKWLFWAVAAATNEHKTNTEKNRKTQKKNQMKTKHILDSISYEDTNPPTVERPLLRHTNYFHSNHAQFDKEVNISQFPSSNETKKKKQKWTETLNTSRYWTCSNEANGVGTCLFPVNRVAGWLATPHLQQKQHNAVPPNSVHIRA